MDPAEYIIHAERGTLETIWVACLHWFDADRVVLVGQLHSRARDTDFDPTGQSEFLALDGSPADLAAFRAAAHPRPARPVS